MVLQTVKLASLLVKQISRPIVHRIGESAKHHVKFRSVIERIGQSYHTMDYTLQSKLLGFRRPIRVKLLSEDDALNVGTKILGETFVYGISASFLLYEYNRSQIKDKDKMYKMELFKRNIYLNENETEAEIKNMKREIDAFKETLLIDVSRNYLDRPYVDMFVNLFIHLLLFIYFVFS